jgi:hypothetical protein
MDWKERQALNEELKKTIVKSQHASALMNKKLICIQTHSGYGGYWLRDPKGVQHLLPADTSDQMLGDAVLDAMAHSRFLITKIPVDGGWVHPEATVAEADLFYYKKIEERHKKWVSALMESTGYKTKSALFKGMKNCSITREKGEIRIDSWRRVRSDAWSGLDPPYDVTIPESSTAEEIGAALRLAFEHAKG